jgi:C4-dicarboxylate transporter DctM subunit
VLTRLGLSQELTSMIVEADIKPWQFLLAINLVMIMLGMFLDGISLIVLLSPVLFPMANAAGVNPIHFAVIITALVEIATLTPPIGLNLFVMSRIAKLPVLKIARSVLPFYSVQLFGLLLINAVPLLSLALVP